MGDVYFYHLTRSALAPTLLNLLGKCRAQGWRVNVLGSEQGQLDSLDEQLWAGHKESFLPHGRAGGEHDLLQPILLSCPNAGEPQMLSPDVLACVLGATITAEQVQAAQRTMIVFDGLDAEAVGHARGQWKALTSAGCGARYWSEESGRWEEKAKANLS